MMTFILRVLLFLIIFAFGPESGCMASPVANALDQAKLKYHSEDYKKTLKDLSFYLDHNKGDKEALRLRAKTYLALGEFDLAISDLESMTIEPGPLELAMKNQSDVNRNDSDDLNYPDWMQSLVL